MKIRCIFRGAATIGALLGIFISTAASQDQPPNSPRISRPPSASSAPSGSRRSSRQQPSETEQFFFDAANHERAAQGLSQLKWDNALAAAARKHAALMANEGDMAHQLPGEPTLAQRASDAGARFSRVAENIAVGPDPSSIHIGWMDSPGHRANILGAKYNALGVGVVEADGQLYAVEDFSTAVEALSIEQQEEKVAAMLKARGFRVTEDRSEARSVCSGKAHIDNVPDIRTSMQILQYETPDLSNFNAEMDRKLRASTFRHAAVGACNPKDADKGLPRFHVVVLLY